jgi:hypothetical protein
LPTFTNRAKPDRVPRSSKEFPFPDNNLAQFLGLNEGTVFLASTKRTKSYYVLYGEHFNWPNDRKPQA